MSIWNRIFLGQKACSVKIFHFDAFDKSPMDIRPSTNFHYRSPSKKCNSNRKPRQKRKKGDKGRRLIKIDSNGLAFEQRKKRGNSMVPFREEVEFWRETREHKEKTYLILKFNWKFSMFSITKWLFHFLMWKHVTNSW